MRVWGTERKFFNTLHRFASQKGPAKKIHGSKGHRQMAHLLNTPVAGTCSEREARTRSIDYVAYALSGCNFRSEVNARDMFASQFIARIEVLCSCDGLIIVFKCNFHFRCNFRCFGNSEGFSATPCMLIPKSGVRGSGELYPW